MSFKQYKVDDKYITVIGEKHRAVNEKCPYPSISVASFLKRATARLEDSCVLLEMHADKQVEIERFRSINIIDAINLFFKDDYDRVKGFDIRNQYVDMSKLYDENTLLVDYMNLYYGDRMLMVINVLNDLVISSGLSNNKKTYLHQFVDNLYSDYNLITTYFLPQIQQAIKYPGITLKEYLKDGLSAGDYKVNMVIIHFWAKVTDFMLLFSIWNSPCKYIFVLVGNVHADNLHNIFKDDLQFSKLGNANHCVEISGALWDVVRKVGL
jgi:hypothetical protein